MCRWEALRQAGLPQNMSKEIAVFHLVPRHSNSQRVTQECASLIFFNFTVCHPCCLITGT